jgi:hypothetical protein
MPCDERSIRLIANQIVPSGFADKLAKAFELLPGLRVGRRKLLVLVSHAGEPL